MTFDDYIKNPMGKKNMVFSNTEMYRKMYNDKLGKILLRETGRLQYFLYTSNGDYFIHMKIPSEVVPKFYYDTVIQFYTKNPVVSMDKNLKKYDVKFYSNDPSFVFTFAHAFRENDLFVELLKPKMSKLAIKNVAKERNPKDTVGYVKSIFFCYIIMNSRGLFDKIQYDTYGSRLNVKQFLTTVEDADKKIADRQLAQDIMNKDKKLKKTQDQKVSQQPRQVVNQKNPVEKNTKQAKTIGKTSYTKTVKRK